MNKSTEAGHHGQDGERPPIPDPLQGIEDQVKKLKPDYITLAIDNCEIRADDEIQEPPVCLEISSGESNTTFGTLGNFGAIIGKPKSRKTFVGTGITAALVSNDSVLNFTGKLPDDKRNVLYIDTEMEKYHVLQLTRRIAKLSGNAWGEHPSNLKVYGLRKYLPNQRLAIIEDLIYNTDDLGFVVIDGLRDLVNSINDEEEATKVTSALLRWTEELGIYILTVLHQNKGDGNARGHLGTELVNKAETIISVSKLESDKHISEVKSEFTRNADFDSFFIGIDGDTLPYVEGDYVKKKKTKAAEWQQIPDKDHIKKVREMMLHPNCREYKTDKSARDLTNYISEHYKVSDKVARDILKYFWHDKGWIYNRNDGVRNGMSYRLCISPELDQFTGGMV